MIVAEPLGPSNPQIQTLRRLLGRRSARLDEGRYVIEGPLLVADALRAGVDIEAVYVEGQSRRRRGEGIEELVDQQFPQAEQRGDVDGVLEPRERRL